MDISTNIYLEDYKIGNQIFCILVPKRKKNITSTHMETFRRLMSVITLSREMLTWKTFDQ